MGRVCGISTIQMKNGLTMKRTTIATSALALAFSLIAGVSSAVTDKVADEDFSGSAFDGGISSTAISTNGLSWTCSDSDAAEVVSEALSVDAATNAPVKAAFDKASNINAVLADGGTATFSVSAVFTPATETPVIPNDNDDLKFALYALVSGGATNLYVRANGGDADTGIDVSGTESTTVEVNFLSSSTFTVKANDTTAPAGGYYTFASGTGINSIEFAGTSTIDDIVVTTESTWDAYLGGTIATDTYGIDNLAELLKFQRGVARGIATDGLTFKLTADIALTNAWPGIGIQNGKDIYGTEEFANGAFKGTFDGQNFTVSNFQMAGGNLDYCGFFNSITNATIQNLKISYKEGTFATDSSSSTEECGATFVGVAACSTMRNLVTLSSPISAVSSGKGIGGIVGYLGNDSTVDSCTNNVSLTSLKNNKVGGIVMICQKTGSTISNCQNNGTATTSSGEYGGIVGYTDSITISDCENTAAVKMFYHHGGTVTLSGTNKGNATVVAYTGNATPGLNFATVSGDVATFVADSALAAGNTYKVMASDATATYVLTTAGETIEFNTALFTPTYAITAASGLNVTSSTSGTVTTYTATTGYVADQTPTFSDSTSKFLSDDEAKYLNSVIAAGSEKSDVDSKLAATSVEDFEKAYLLNQDITKSSAAQASFDITSIKRSGSDVIVGITLNRSGKPLGGVNGIASLYVASSPTNDYAQAGSDVVFTFPDSTEAVQTVTTNFTNLAGTFFKVKIEAAE